MADNVAITPGSGATVAADDIGSGVLAQRVKPVWGVDGVGNDISAAFGLPIQSGFQELTGTAAALNADAVASTDVRGYQSLVVQVSGTFSATLSLQFSNDNAIWTTVGITYNVSGFPGTGSFSSATLAVCPVQARFMRIRATSYTSGTAVVTAELSALPLAPLTTGVQQFSGNTWQVAATVSAASVPNDAASSTSLLTAVQDLYSPAQSFPYVRARTPDTRKTVATATTGNTALWTPTSGKKFRLMRFLVNVTANAATSGGAVLTIDFQDSTTGLTLGQSVFVPATAVTTGGPPMLHSGWIDLGNGYLSAVANNVLNLNLSAALTSGVVNVVAVGTEE
jgi:hypothetical protein